MRQPTSSLRRRGTIAIIMAVCASMLLAFVAIAVDGGVLQDERRHAQATADAAALAGAAVIFEEYARYEGKDANGHVRQAALRCANQNGYANDHTNSDVTVNIPPDSGPYAGMDSYIEVLVTYYQPRAFSRIFGSDRIPVRARAVARGAWVAPNIGVIVLDYTGKATLTTQGNGAFTESGAPVLVNSNNPAAVVDGGNGILVSPEFRITGNYTNSGNGQMITKPIPNNIFTGVHPTPDPLAYLPEPTPPPAGTITAVSIGQGNTQYTLTPGTFYDLPNFNTGDVVIFKQASAGNDGIYYLGRGGFHSTGASIKMDSNTSGGIMVFNAGTQTSDSFYISGNANGSVRFGPRTDGMYKGLTYFQERSATEEVHIEGNGDFDIRGTFYLAGAQLQVTGNGAMSNVGSQYVSRELTMAGNGNVGITYAGNNVAPTRIITLVE